MGADQHLDWAASARSVLDWWREAGVDVLVGDEPHDWLGQAPAAIPVPAATAAPPVARALPDTLDAFAAWRTGGDAPEGAAPDGRFAEGDPASALMIVVDCPADTGLIDGAPGRLFDRMLAAIGHSRESIYLTSLTTVRPLGGRIPPETLPALADLLRHHLTLVRPQRLLLLGQAPSRALDATDGSGAAGGLRPINLDGTIVSPVSTLHPRLLIERPALKVQAWKDLQILMGNQR